MRYIKLFSIAAACLLLSVAVSYPEARKEVILRSSEHEDFFRLVFEAGDDSFIKDASVTIAQKHLKLRFPSSFALKQHGKTFFEISQQDNNLSINVGRPFKIKPLKLTSPPRLSIDVMKEAKDQKPQVKEQADFDLPSGFRVVLDAGHGGYEIGILEGSAREKDITLSLARSIERLILKKGRTAYLTRRADQFMSITDRALSANQKNPDVFISVHVSMSDSFGVYTSVAEAGSGEPSIKELYGLISRQMRYIEKSKALSGHIGKAIESEFKNDVIQREMNLPLLNAASSAAVLIEVPLSVASGPAGQDKISHALLKGVASYANK